ncbi:MAG: hypothetical protein ACJ8GN_12965 [Longimicrobiaceae bacterium]
MKRRHTLALLGTAAAFALAACGGGGNDGGARSDASANSDSAANSASAPDTTTARDAANAGLKPLDTAGAAVESGPHITVGRTGEHGEFLADKVGRPLYMYTADTNGQSACAGACASLWPPLIALQGTPSVGTDKVQASLLGTVRRPDGNQQVTYNGHPLYYYQKDQGTTPTGNDVKDAGGEWYLVTPAGEKMEDHGEHEAGDDKGGRS